MFSVLQFFTISLRNSREKIAAILLERAAASGEPYIRLARPCCCVRWRAGRPFVFNVSFGVFQFVGVRLVLAVVVAATEAAGAYKEVSYEHPPPAS